MVVKKVAGYNLVEPIIQNAGSRFFHIQWISLMQCIFISISDYITIILKAKLLKCRFNCMHQNVYQIGIYT